MQNLSKNIWFSLLNIVFTTIVTLVAIRILLTTLGNVKFGVFSIITILNSLSSLFSFGLNYTLLHYIPKQGKGEESSMDIIVVLFISFFISLLLGGTVYFAAPAIAGLISTPEELMGETVQFIRYISFTILFLLPIQILIAVFDAIQKNYISNILQVVFSFLYWSVLAASTLYSGNLADAGLSLSLLYPAWFFVLVICFKKIWGPVVIPKIKDQYQRIFRKHITSGSKYFATNIVGYLNEPISKLLISHFIGLESVAFFDIAMRVKNQVWGLFNKLTYPFLPYFSSQKDKLEVKKQIISLTAVILVFASIISLYFLWAGNYIVLLWLKSDSLVLVRFVIISVVSYLMFSAIVFPVYYYFIAENKADFLILIQLTGSVVNIGLFFLLKNQVPEYSIIISHSLSLFIAMLLSFYLYKKYDKTITAIDAGKVISALKFVIPFIIITLVVLLVHYYIDWATIYWFLSGSVVFAVTTLLLLKHAGFNHRFPIIRTLTGGLVR